MLHLLYKLYFIKFSNRRVDDLHHRIIARAINFLFPIYCKITHWIFALTNTASVKGNGQNYIVSLTTFPARLEKVWITIESILRQSRKPDRIILWLAKDEIPNDQELPKNLTKLKRRGLEIRFCKENIKPHNKYYHTLLEFPEANIITVDDDIIYPNDLIGKLVKSHKKYPDSISSILARRITLSQNKSINSYREWKYISENSSPSHAYLNLGVGGVLYPSKCLHNEVFNIQVLKEKCLIADDLWLKIMALKNDTKVRSLAGEYSRFFVTIRDSQNVTLSEENIGSGANDEQFQLLINYYNISSLAFNK